ncbi:hypothetical protein BXZ70DRAFT_1066970 [Cristinia sonorae]|uniref:MYND-type domain-containing protein n=1 Tax=Cristinia sonorae TaxID=1940300 RepID=A0A8K0UJ38_9AGAR|nr:hypothetical protein BXZ70DRAFT_1066970 [Cristinia sonorae]
MEPLDWNKHYDLANLPKFDMTLCWNCKAPATKVCSGCKETRYCTSECQKAHWKKHKAHCKMFGQMHMMGELPKIMKKNEPKYKGPSMGRCSGCNVRFTPNYPPNDKCPECGYTACESCVVHEVRGTCHCTNHNFGRTYCIMEPRWYHKNGKTGEPYIGDRHPEDPLHEYTPDMYEPVERQCNNCKKITKVFKKEYWNPQRFNTSWF